MMSPEMAIEIIERELRMEDGVETVEFDFIGGEPLLEFDTIRTVVEYITAREYGKDYIFFATTNGVPLDEER